MYQFLETIRLEEGNLVNQNYHQSRINDTSKYFSLNGFDLDKLTIPKQFMKGLFKLRIEYANTILKIEYQEYKIKQIDSLKIIEDNSIIYNFKYLNRSRINKLLEKKDDCDDIIILKNGEITDTSYSNLIFVKNGEYFTPINPLLNGTKRRYLIDLREIIPNLIKPRDLDNYEYCKIFNAMINIEDSPIIKNIKL